MATLTMTLELKNVNTDYPALIKLVKSKLKGDCNVKVSGYFIRLDTARLKKESIVEAFKESLRELNADTSHLAPNTKFVFREMKPNGSLKKTCINFNTDQRSTYGSITNAT